MAAMRIARAADHGATVEGPPTGWRPRALSIKEKLEVVVRQSGKEPGGDRLNPLDGVQFDHDPALHRRTWDAEARDTVPAANDLDYIVALNCATHREKTAKRDIKEIRKTQRLEAKRAGKVKRKAKIMSRNTLRKKA